MGDITSEDVVRYYLQAKVKEARKTKPKMLAFDLPQEEWLPETPKFSKDDMYRILVEMQKEEIIAGHSILPKPTRSAAEQMAEYHSRDISPEEDHKRALEQARLLREIHYKSLLDEMDAN